MAAVVNDVGTRDIDAAEQRRADRAARKRSLSIDAKRFIAIVCAIISVLAASPTGFMLAISSTRFGLVHLHGAASVLGMIAVVFLFPGVIVWGRDRLFFFLSMYCLSFAAVFGTAFTAAFNLFQSAAGNPEVTRQMRPAGQRLLQDLRLDWTLPTTIIVVAVLAGIGLLIIDRGDTKKAAAAGG